MLAVAGVFQFSRLKYHCLDKCRTPLGFVTSHWHGPRPQRESFMLGLAHGMFCVGCCWALMLLMFLVGMGNMAWMFSWTGDGGGEEPLVGSAPVCTSRWFPNRGGGITRLACIGLIGG